MATLDNDDFTQMKRHIKNSDMKLTFQNWTVPGGNSISKQQLKAAMQAAEDWFVGALTTAPTESFKAAIEVETGANTNAQAKAIGRVWMNWRYGRDI